MPSHGTPTSLPIPLPEPIAVLAFAIVALAVVLAAALRSGRAQDNDELVDYRIVNGAIPEPLTDQPGDPERGRRIVLDREGGDCTICHAMPLPQRQFHGTIGPPL